MLSDREKFKALMRAHLGDDFIVKDLGHGDIVVTMRGCVIDMVGHVPPASKALKVRLQVKLWLHRAVNELRRDMLAFTEAGAREAAATIEALMKIEREARL